MIGIIKFRESVLQRAKSGTIGYESGPELINVINESQLELATTLSRHIERNQSVKDALTFLVTPGEKSTSAAGLLDIDLNIMIRFMSVISAAGKIAYPINSNEISTINNSAIRKPSVEKGKIFYYQTGAGYSFLPETVMPIKYLYVRKPKEVKFTLVPVSNADSDYVTVSTTTSTLQDLEWPETMFNILLYMVLEKLGMEMKEPILIEYANMGLQKEQLNIQ